MHPTDPTSNKAKQTNEAHWNLLPFNIRGKIFKWGQSIDDFSFQIIK